MKKWLCFASLMLLVGCAAKTDPNRNSVLWVQTAAEYQANALQVYNAAMQNLETAVADQTWTAALEQTNNFFELPPAVIFDLDETVLNNSRYQAQLVIEQTVFCISSWDKWLAAGQADIIPGAAEFIRYIQSQGIEPIFISNRACRQRKESFYECPQKSDTIRNLNNLGITDISGSNVLLKNEFSDWGSEKKNRREYVIQKYRIIMIFGDDLGDFIPNVKTDITMERRMEMTSIYQENWGKTWYILPNPMYGSWYQLLKPPKEQYLKGIKENRVNQY